MSSKRRHTKAEDAYLGRVAAMRCRLCKLLDMHQATPTAIHHPRTGYGGAERAPHWLAIPLCWDCHQGPTGLHGDKSLLRIAKVGELDLLADTIKELNP